LNITQFIDKQAASTERIDAKVATHETTINTHSSKFAGYDKSISDLKSDMTLKAKSEDLSELQKVVGTLDSGI
jgi:environmental stress-induced protein Ves